jgi:hypothetical protein
MESQTKDNVLAQVRLALVHTRSVAISAAKLLEESKQNDLVTQQCQDLLKKLCNMEHQVYDHASALAFLKTKVEAMGPLIPEHQVEDALSWLDENLDFEIFQPKLNKRDLIKRSQEVDNRVETINREIWERVHPGVPFPNGNEDAHSAELVVVGAENQNRLVCPLTLTRIVSPMKNRNCGHSYSKSAILTHIDSCQAEGMLKCPVAGCNALLSKQSLERDIETEFALEKLNQVRTADSQYQEHDNREDDSDQHVDLDFS